MKETEPRYISGREVFINQLSNAGFLPSEIAAAFVGDDKPSLVEGVIVKGKDYYFSLDFLKFIHKSVDSDSGTTRRAFLESYLAGSLLLQSGSKKMVAASNNFIKNNPDSESKTSKELGLYIRNVFMDENEIGRHQGFMLLGLEIFQNKALYDIFDNKVYNLIDFMKKKGIDDRKLLDYGEIAYLIAHSEYGVELIKGKTQDFLSRLRSVTALPEIVNSKELTDVFVDFFSEEENWERRLNFFEPAMRAFDYPFVDRRDLEYVLLNDFIKTLSKKNPKLTDVDRWREIRNATPQMREGLVYFLASKEKKGKSMFNFLQGIEKRLPPNRHKENQVLVGESIWDPVVSLEIARTVGYEVEYKDPLDKSVNLARRVAASLGFYEGDGGHGGDYKETSPGPFWHPQTGIKVFGKYLDAGIINLYDYSGGDKSEHFNIGVEFAEDEFTFLTRAKHLTGAGFYEKRNFTKDELKIISNTQTPAVRYTEIKGYDVITREEFNWDWETNCYLGWSIGAYRSSLTETKSTPGIKWKKQLHEIWNGYVKSMTVGAEQTVTMDYLYEKSNKSPFVYAAVKQIRYIFSHKQARFGALRNIDSTFHPKIKPVRIGDRYWPNIAIFSRDVVNHSVFKIKQVISSIYAEAKADILRIDGMTTNRDEELRNFMAKYKYHQVAYTNNITSKDAYRYISAYLKTHVK